MVSILIFIIGLVIYASYGLGGLCWLLLATAVSYCAGLWIPRHKWVMPLAVAIHVLCLLAVKLQGITGFSLVAPLGISYLTLQMISYLVDVSKGKLAPERNLLRYALSVTYLPHVFFGPIMCQDKISAALFENRRFSWDGVLEGGCRVLWGLFKRMIIAARAGAAIAVITADTSAYLGGWVLVAVGLYSVQLYCDFSGGMDLVLGVSRMLGIGIAENFDAPFFSQTVSEFWRRWHITLGAWLREYVYIPLGGNRKGKVRKMLNLVVTFLVSGLWHGLSYLLWGFCHGLLVALGDKCKTPLKWLNRLLTCLMVTLLWAFFVWPNTATSLSMLGSLVTTFNYGAVAAGLSQLGLTLGDWLVLIVAFAGVLCYDGNAASIKVWLKNRAPWIKLAVMGVLGILVLVFGMYGLGFNAQAFIYSRF